MQHQQQKNHDSSQIIDFGQLIIQFKQKYWVHLQKKYQRQIIHHSQTVKVISDNEESLYELLQNLIKNAVHNKISDANIGKIDIKNAKIFISQLLVQIKIIYLKYISKKSNYETKTLKLHYQKIQDFLHKSVNFLKTQFPRSSKIQPGQLSKLFKQFDITSMYEYDILKQLRFCFDSEDQIEITSNVKKIINQLINIIDQNFDRFTKIIKTVNQGLRTSRKIPKNTTRYTKFDTSVFEFKSRTISRVITKWVQMLDKILKDPINQVTLDKQYRFYSKNNLYQLVLKPSDRANLKIILQDENYDPKNNLSLHNSLKAENNHFEKWMTQQQKKLIDYQMHLIKLFNLNIKKPTINNSHNIQLSQMEMEMIKFSSYVTNFIDWMNEQRLVQIIKELVKVSKLCKRQRGVLDLVKFPVSDLMRCQIFGNSQTIIETFQALKQCHSQMLIQIVQIRNRFDKPLNDAMIFFKIYGCPLICQCQLILSDQSQKGSDISRNTLQINHFLYELQRSPFGVVNQAANFIKLNCEIVSEYNKKIRLDFSKQTMIKNCNESNHTNSYTSRRVQPIVCSKCFKFYYKNQNYYSVFHCQQCNIYLCNKCESKVTQLNRQTIEEHLNKKIIQQNKNYLITGKQIYEKLFKKQNQSIHQIFKCKKCQSKKYIKASDLINHLCRINQIDLNEQLDVYFCIAQKVIFQTNHAPQIKIKCFKYDIGKMEIQNVYNYLQTYQKHESFDFQGSEMVLEFNNQLRKKQQQNIYLIKEEQRFENIKQHAIFIFDGQNAKTVKNCVKQNSSSFFLYEKIRQYLIIINVQQNFVKAGDKQKFKLKIGQQFSTNPFMRFLKLRHQKLSNSHLQIFHQIQRFNLIKQLDVSHNLIKDIHDILIHGDQLRKIILDNNQITQIKFKKQHKNLYKLSARHNKIKIIKGVYYLPVLDQLDLGFNELDDSFLNNKDNLQIEPTSAEHKGQCPQQKSSSSHTRKIKEGQFDGTTNRFHQKKNMIHKLANQFRNKVTQQNSQSIDSVPRQLYFRVLVELKLQFNKLTSIKAIIRNKRTFFPYLNVLNLAGNQIQQIPNIFYSMPKLNKFNYSLNPVIKTHSFYVKTVFSEINYSNLHSLKISHQRCVQIPIHITQNLKIFSYTNSYLKDEDLQKMVLKKNQSDRFPVLQQLFLSKNLLTKTPSISNLPKLIKLYLEGNPLYVFDTFFYSQKESYCKLQNLWISVLTQSNSQSQTQTIPQDLYIQVEKKIQKIISKNPKIQHSLQVASSSNNNCSLKNIICLKYSKSLSKQIDQFYQHIKELQLIEKQLQLQRNQIQHVQIIDDVLIMQKKSESCNNPIQPISILNVSNNKSDLIHRRQVNRLNCKHFYHYTMSIRRYLLDTFQNQQTIQKNYRLCSNQNTGFYSLNLAHRPLVIPYFIHYDWQCLYELKLVDKHFDNDKWRQFVKNVKYYPNLRKIELKQNMIVQINKQQLAKIEKLQYFYLTNTKWYNHLSQKSKKQIVQFMKQKNNIVQISYTQQKNTTTTIKKSINK